MINESPIFFINNPDKPTWHTNLPFERQSRDAQQFMIEEAKRIRRGIYIGGVRIHPWLYWHINFWGIMIDELQEDGSTLPKHSTPNLRDVEWMFQEALFVAEKQKKGVAGGGSRRIAKSAMISSYTAHRGHTIYGGELRVNSVVGGSQADLDQITQYITYGIDNLHPFFKMDRVGKNWDTGVTLGTRNVDNTVDIFSKFTITNVNAGAKSSSQKSAGATPNTFIMDEALKWDEPVLTPNGFVNIEDIQVGDEVYGEDGLPATVIRKIDVGKKQLYAFIFDNGVRIESCLDHNWKVYNTETEQYEELKTEDIISSFEKNKYEIHKIYPVKSKVVISDIEKTEIEQAYCLTVNNESHSFLTRDFIPTKNCGKFPCLKTLNVAKYSFATQYGWRTSPLLFGCVCKGTKVYDKNGVLRNIEDITAETGILGYDGENTSVENIPWIQPPKQKLCYRIETSNGKFIECSHDHPLMIKRGDNVVFEKAENIKEGDKVFVHGGVKPFGKKKQFMASLIGLMIGDGYYGLGTELYVSDKDVSKYIEDRYYGFVTKHRRTTEEPYFTTICFAGLTNVFKYHGIYGDTKNNKKLPVDIWEWDKESVSELLKGYFEADGYISNENNRARITLTSTCKKLMVEVSEQLERFGIISKIYHRKNNKESVLKSNVNNKVSIIKSSDSYSLEITKKEFVELFHKHIGFISSRKQNRLESKIKNKSFYGGKTYAFDKTIEGKGDYFVDKTCANLIPLKVQKVENIGEQDIYNLEAGVTHTYITNGFISHNTSGDLTASRDFQRILTNPAEYNMITMNWDWLEKRFKNPTWDRQVFGIFFPGQMSLEGTIPKVRTTLDKFLNIESEELKAIEIYDTPWEDKTKEFLERREKLKKVDITTYNDELMHIPLNPDEMFMELGKNPFPVTEATAHLKRITQSGDVGRVCDFVDLGQGNGKVEIVDTNKPIADFPFEGGILDCAIKVFENPPDDNSFDFTYVAGLDHYKHTESTGDSIGALYVYKRKVNINDEFEDSIVCSYVSRPPSMTTFNRKCEMILEAYGAQCLQENADISFQQYLEAKNKDIKLLANGQEIVTRMINSNGKQVNKYGLSPTVKNKEYLLNLVITYCQEDIDSYINDKGEEVRVKGVERIKDVQLLHEIIEYKPGKNVDRIVAFGHSLVWARYLDDIRVVPKIKGREPREMDMETYTERRQLLQEKVRSKYGRRNLGRFNPYGLRR